MMYEGLTATAKHGQFMALHIDFYESGSQTQALRDLIQRNRGESFLGLPGRARQELFPHPLQGQVRGVAARPGKKQKRFARKGPVKGGKGGMKFGEPGGIGLEQNHGAADFWCQKAGIPTVVAADVDGVSSRISPVTGLAFQSVLGPALPKVQHAADTTGRIPANAVPKPRRHLRVFSGAPGNSQGPKAEAKTGTKGGDAFPGAGAVKTWQAQSWHPVGICIPSLYRSPHGGAKEMLG